MNDHALLHLVRRYLVPARTWLYNTNVGLYKDYSRCTAAVNNRNHHDCVAVVGVSLSPPPLLLLFFIVILLYKVGVFIFQYQVQSTGVGFMSIYIGMFGLSDSADMCYHGYEYCWCVTPSWRIWSPFSGLVDEPGAGMVGDRLTSVLSLHTQAPAARGRRKQT